MAKPVPKHKDGQPFKTPYRQVAFRLTDAEYAQLESIRDEGGHKSVSGTAASMIKEILSDEREIST